MYGPVCTVVWEGRSRKASPYPDQDKFSDMLRGLSRADRRFHATLRLMSKIKQTSADSNTPLVSRHGAGRTAFVLGRRAFAKVSAVEGIDVPDHLEAALSELADADGNERRDALASKYGKA